MLVSVGSRAKATCTYYIGNMPIYLYIVFILFEMPFLGG